MKKARQYRRKPDANPPGRPKVLAGDTQIVTIHLPRDICAEIDVAVKATNGKYSNRSDFIRQALESALEKKEIKKPAPSELALLAEPLATLQVLNYPKSHIYIYTRGPLKGKRCIVRTGKDGTVYPPQILDLEKADKKRTKA